MAKKNKDFSSDFDFLTDKLKEIQKEITADVNKGLDEAADYLVGELEANTPTKTGLTKESWITEKKYNNVKYINNTSLNKKKIPVVNLLEYGSKGKPFVRKTLKASQDKIIQIIESSVKGGEGG